jgi:hypothetical protein
MFAIIGWGGCGRTLGCSLKEDQFLYLFYADRPRLPSCWADTISEWDQSDLQTICDIMQVEFLLYSRLDVKIHSWDVVIIFCL